MGRRRFNIARAQRGLSMVGRHVEYSRVGRGERRKPRGGGLGEVIGGGGSGGGGEWMTERGGGEGTKDRADEGGGCFIHTYNIQRMFFFGAGRRGRSSATTFIRIHPNRRRRRRRSDASEPTPPSIDHSRRRRRRRRHLPQPIGRHESAVSRR